MTEVLRLCLLGSQAVNLGQAPVSAFITNKAEALLYYLAVTGRPHSRMALAALLWGEFPDSNALKNLRDVLSNLRRLVPEHLLIDRQTAAFNRDAPYWLDAEQFARRAAQLKQPSFIVSPANVKSLQEAAGLYKGEFLQGFQVEEEPFQAWQRQQQEMYLQSAIGCLYALAGFFTEEGAYETAIDYCQRLLQLAPWHEEAHCRLMQLYTLTRQRSAALTQYQRCQEALAEELGVEPTAETTRLYERIIDGLFPQRTEEAGRKQPSPRQPPAHNLPGRPTTFIGRESELAQVLAYLQSPECHLLSLVGVGGVGKTRLALQAAHALLESVTEGSGFSQGIYFIPLAGLESTELLPATIANALGVSLFGAEEPAVQLTSYLRDKEMLLIFDNFEHLITGGSLITAILQSGTKTKILATSRERLHLYGERVLELKGLPTVDGEETIGGAVISSAVRLFEQYAQTFRSDFHPQSPAEQQVMRQICQLLDGLPLGIELAASWTRLLSLAEIADEMAQTLDFLESPTRDTPVRHHSLRTVFDYSWNLLAPGEQHILGRLSVFRGGFTREAADVVCRASLHTLASLVDKSLLDCIIRETSGKNDMRYEILEVIRQFAAERLAADPAGQREIRWGHSVYYAGFLAHLKDDLEDGAQPEALAKIRQEIENIRSSWHWAVENREWAVLDQAVDSLFYFYDMSSWFQEGREAFAQAAAHLERDITTGDEALNRCVLGRLLARQSWFTFHLGRQREAQALLEKSLVIMRRLNSVPEMVFSLNYLGAVTYYLGDYTAALACCQEALALSQSLTGGLGTTIAHNILCQIEILLGNYDSAEEHGRQVIALTQPVKNLWSMSYALVNLGDVALVRGDYNQARRYFLESKTLREEIRDQRGTAICLNRLGDVAKTTGQLAEARELYRQSLRIYQDISNQWGMAFTFGRLAWVMLELRGAGETSVEAAGDYIRQALTLARSIGAEALVLDALAGTAAIRLQGPGGREEKETILAQELLLFVTNHSSSTRMTCDQVARLLSRFPPPAGRLGFRGTLAEAAEMALQILEKE